MKSAQISVFVALDVSISPWPAVQGAAKTVSPSHAADWPQWRGPNADGVADSRGLPTHWSPTQNIRWSVKLPGWGTSSPVVYGDRLFVTAQVEQGGKKSLLTLCLHRTPAKNCGGMTSVWT